MMFIHKPVCLLICSKEPLMRLTLKKHCIFWSHFM